MDIEPGTGTQFVDVTNPDVTDELAALLLRCLAKKRDDRPGTFHEALKSLNALRIFKSDPIVRNT